jgi:hypothetical protein
VEVRESLERIVSSRRWRASPRLAAFLRYVVERTLAGEKRQIKSYTIAVEALGRDPRFDPQADPIVRVEAGRLRRALAHYYAGDGRNEPIVIELPRGSYVPHFRQRGCGLGAGGADRGMLQAAFERLSELRRQLELIAAEFEIAEARPERAAPAP